MAGQRESIVRLSRSVFVDTSAWIGFFAADDEHHTQAVTAFDMLGDSDRPLVTSDYVVAETVTFLRTRYDHSLTLRAWDALESEETVFILQAEKRHRELAKRIFKKYAQLNLSLPDCVSFVLMREFGIQEALTFDDDFEKVGFSLVCGG